MDEITNSNSTRWMDLGPIDYTTSTTDGTCILNFTTNSTWSFIDNYSVWPKGISDPSMESKITPKWHILQGFKNQIKHMWD